ncbi:HmuY family protein [Aurantibacter sp.]|uniref:HmuY family protein n=1 Tax=Aurantibacter sp. TaxID=2807103 RepID=UPI003264F5A2
MKKTIKLIPILFLLVLAACSSDDNTVVPEEFVVAFENPSVSFNATESEKEINLIFSTVAPEDGTISISFTGTNAVYGSSEDFVTDPAADNGVISISVASGATSASFSFTKLKDAIEGMEKSIDFSIATVNVGGGITSGNTTMQVAFAETAALGGNIESEVGGPNEPNQVYVDLSGQNQTSVNRESWDLAFYNGDSFRVAINGSVFMAVSELDAVDIDAVDAASVADLQPTVAVGTFDAANTVFVDSPDGVITGTAIAEISETDSENKVYLVNLGSEIGTETPENGSVAVSGESRGWMKIRVLRNETDYTLQYAGLDETTHSEVTIAKDAAYNFQFFSLMTENEIVVEPIKDKWDLNFTVFTNEIEGYGSYGYSDFVTTNSKAGTMAYMVEVETLAYADFELSNVDESLFEDDQRVIGSNWRNGGGPGSLPSLKEDVYFILKDSDGNTYKLKFTALVNESGVRGYPAFEYTLLQ